MSTSLELTLKTAKEYFEKGVLSNSRSDLEMSVSIYKEAIEIDPENYNIYNNLGCTYIHLGENDKAIKSLKKAIEIDPINTELYCNLGSIYNLSEQYKKAIKSFKKAIKIDPENYRIYNNLGCTYIQSEEPDKAIDILQRSLQIDPENIVSYINLWRIYIQSEEHNKAIDILQRSLKINPDPFIYGHLGISYNLIQDSESATMCFDEALELFSKKTNKDQNDYTFVKEIMIELEILQNNRKPGSNAFYIEDHQKSIH